MARQGEVSVKFKDLAVGIYAASAVHDKDGNNRLTTNFMGIPTEPYGFTGHGKGSCGPPAIRRHILFPAIGRLGSGYCNEEAGG